MAYNPTPPLGGLTPEAFLADYWQKQPLLIRGAFPGFTSPLTPDGLMALAGEEEVLARLIVERGGAYPWELRYGPFQDADFDDLPPTHWTLLVQEADRHVQEVAGLLDAFRFIPNWRMDDVMISYAPEHGGVGAHVDNYDVFLVQGLGHRRWAINHTPVEAEHLVPDLDVSMLADFEADASWVLAPGDVLYLPPRIPHYGVALDDCMTYSIGFRAPSHLDLALGFADHLAETLDPLRRYADPDLHPQPHPGEISAGALHTIGNTLRGLLTDAALHDWFGRFITLPRRSEPALPLDDPYTPGALRAALDAGAVLYRIAVPDLAFINHPDGTATLFAAGEAHPLSADLAYAAPLLTGTAPLDPPTLAPHLHDDAFTALLITLVNDGILDLEEE